MFGSRFLPLPSSDEETWASDEYNPHADQVRFVRPECITVLFAWARSHDFLSVCFFCTRARSHISWIFSSPICASPSRRFTHQYKVNAEHRRDRICRRFERTLNHGDPARRGDGDPELPYRRRQGEYKTVLHWGQRKLHVSEIEFLTEFGFPYCHVVYAGAASGTHIKQLSDMFPDVTFHLYDPSPFTVLPTERIRIHNELFTDEIARSFLGCKVRVWF